MTDLCTKFEISTLTHYKGDEKMQTIGWFWELGVTQGHQQHSHSIERI